MKPCWPVYGHGPRHRAREMITLMVGRVRRTVALLVLAVHVLPLSAPPLAANERGEVAAWCVLHAYAEHVDCAERVAVCDHVRVHHLLQDAHLIDRRLTILAAEATEAHRFYWTLDAPRTSNLIQK